MAHMESREVAKIHVSVVPELVASEEFDRMARLFGYAKERTCVIEPVGNGNGLCSSCGEELTQYDGFDPFADEYTGKYCLKCGARVEEANVYEYGR